MEYYTSTDFGTADHFVQVKVGAIGPNPGIFTCCRLTDADHYVAIIMNSGTGGLEVWRKNVSWTNLKQGLGGVVGDIIRLECVSTFYRVFLNGVMKAEGSIGDATLTSTKCGLVSVAGVAQDPCLDDYSSGPVSWSTFPVVSTAFIDTFNRADANLEASPVSSSGKTWTHDGLIAGAVSILAGVARSNTSDATGSAYSTGSLTSADHYVQFKVTTASVGNGTGTFFCCRMSDRSNFVGIRAGNAGGGAGAVEVYRRVGGTLTNRYTGPAGTCVAGDVLGLTVVGTNLNVYKNSILLSGPISIGDGGVLTSQSAGIVARSITGEFGDEFQADKL